MRSQSHLSRFADGGASIVRTNHADALSSSPAPLRWRALAGWQRALLTGAAAAFVFATGTAVLEAAAYGPLSHHMSIHILLMNLIVPLIALAVAQGGLPSRLGSAGALAASTVAQLAALWATHAPVVLTSAMQSTAVALTVQAVLAGTALWFWLAVLAQRGAARWRAILALLVTGKLFCLVAVLLIFAPRELYPSMTHAAGHTAGAAAMSDQHLAGLLMVTACPLTYVLAAVIITARWLKEIARQDAVPGEQGA